jgi:hypothetical protein
MLQHAALCLCLLFAACGSTPAVDGGIGGGGTGGGGSGGGGSDAGFDAGTPFTSDAGEIRCGAVTCQTPAQVCCYEDSASPPRCIAAGGACNGPSVECDESPDCQTGAYCCIGDAPILADGGWFGVQKVGACTTDPGVCLPDPLVGKSSIEACQEASECHGTDAGCTLQFCFMNQPVLACGRFGNCH